MDASDVPRLEVEEIQSPVLRRRPAPYLGCHFLLRVNDAAQGRAFLSKILPHVVSANDYHKADAWVAVALTYRGLEALGLPEVSLNSFPQAFREGMAARAAGFGDTGENLPEHWEYPYGSSDVHIAVTLLSTSEEKWREKLALAHRELEGLPEVLTLVREDFLQVPQGRTPFGYRDGISMPNIQGNGVNPIRNPEHEIAAGEFVLGYPGDRGRSIPMPKPDILGRNGTFAGFRKLHSRVATYRNFLRENASPRLNEELLAAKMIGRWRSGAPLILSPDQDRPELGSDLQQVNNFLYKDDPQGARCPLGAHVRRMNPRDSKLSVMSNLNLRRIIRHGFTYGPPLPDDQLQDDGKSRGIFFIFLSATAPDTYEFLRKEWIEDGNFLGLGQQRDPIAGHHDATQSFTIPVRPVRRRIPMLEAFTQTLGGEYCFMPSLSALRWISELKTSTAQTSSPGNGEANATSSI